MMKRILILDEKNYPPDLDEIYRVAVRGIIFIEGKLLMVESNSGELKLPGGGINDGEDDYQTLVREVKEETGYDVILSTIEPFGEIEEKRLSILEDKLWHQISRLYFCQVNPTKGQCNYTEDEIKSGFRQVMYSIEDALKKSQRVLERDGMQAWNQREYKTLLLIRDYIRSYISTYSGL